MVKHTFRRYGLLWSSIIFPMVVLHWWDIIEIHAGIIFVLALFMAFGIPVILKMVAKRRSNKKLRRINCFFDFHYTKDAEVEEFNKCEWCGKDWYYDTSP